VLLASATAVTGTVLHVISHALSKGLLFLVAGGVMHQTEKRDIDLMGGLAGKMPFTAVSSTIAALSIGGAPPFACFISEFLIFVGAFQIIGVDSFYIWPTALMLVATVLSLAYMLRFTSKVFLGQSKQEDSQTEGEAGKKSLEVSTYMKLSFAVLAVLIVIVGVYPTFLLDLIRTVTIG
jgi:NADH-quinone oxidoreductase subunit M